MYLAYKAIKKRHRQRQQAAVASNQNASPPQSKDAPQTSVGPVESNNQDVIETATADHRVDEKAPSTANGSSEQELSPEEKQQKAAETRQRRIYRWRLIFGIFLPSALQALDVTIIASALPWIASDFGEVPQLNWIISAFSLTSAVFIPAWGQLADILGRHTTFQLATFIMLIGSALCTGAPTDAFAMLLVGRALQGMSCAGILLIIKVILADKVSLEENARNNSFFALVASISYAIGPTIGGYLTETSWRWCFAINLPIAVAAIVLTFFLLRPILLGPQPLPEFAERVAAGQQPTLLQRLATIDVGGQALFLAGMTLLVLALTWAGSTYSWSSAHVLAPLVLGVIIVGLYLVWEYHMEPGRYLARRFPHQRPMIRIDLITSRNAGLLMYINFVTGMAMYAVFYFIDIYFTLVLGFTSSKAGVNLLYYTPGLGVGAYSAMFLCNVWPRKTWYPLFLGTIIEAVGMTVLAWALSTKRQSIIYGMMGLTGVGTGLRFMPGTLHGVAFFSDRIASVASVMALAVPLGGAVGTTIMSTVFNNNAGPSSGALSSTSSFTDIDHLPAAQQAALQNSGKMAIVWAFVAILPFMWAGVVASLFLGNADIKSHHPPRFNPDGTRNFQDDVYYGSYLAKQIRRLRRRAVSSGEV